MSETRSNSGASFGVKKMNIQTKMRTLKFTLFFLLIFSAVSIQAGNTFIRGTVTDNASGLTVPGVNILIEGTTIGTVTDLDGKFSLSVEPGTYQLRFSFISYETLLINDVKAVEGQVTVLDNIQMKEAIQELAQVTVTAEAIRNTENALLSMKSKSANMLDGISSTNFRKIGDSDAASSMKRVPGVSVDGGKYVFVRGLGDRYTKTILNGVDIPGLDPDRNTLQMDIFPTNIIDNIIVYKTFSADLPADFTGGVIDITLKDFPEEKKGSAFIGGAYNPNFHFNKDYLTYEGGKTDFLGFDDGTRKSPAGDGDIPFFAQALGSQTKAERYKQILGNFNPTLAAEKQTSLMDYTFGFNIGNQIPKEKITLGYNVAFSYSNSTEFYKNAQYSRYGLSGDPNITEMDNRDLQIGNYGVNSVLMSGLAGFSIKTKSSKYGINLLHLQNGESRAGIFDYISRDQGADFESFQHNLDYNQRSLTNLLINAKHTFNNSKWNLEWKLSPTFSKMQDPDIRFTRYRIGEGSENFVISTESGFPARIWRDLQELNLAGVVNVTRDYTFLGNKAKLKFGTAYTYKDRSFMIQNFDINVRNVPLTGDPNELFQPENLWPYNGSQTDGTTYEAPFLPTNPNKFDANSSYIAGYVSTEVNLMSRLKTIIGVRMENFVQRYTGRNQTGSKVLDNDQVLNDLDFFPTVNLIFNLSDKQNLRASYAKTIARPSFKELSYAEIFDPVSGRTFVGGLFRDANDAEDVEYWNGNLVSTDIHNFDLRWELFNGSGQTVSVSGFYKQFINPIEIVQFATQTGSFQPRNVGNGQVIGGELELRQSLKFISEKVKNFDVTFNFTYTRSRIKLSQTEYDSRVMNARTGQNISEYRDMAGQAPYLVNAGFAYNGSKKGFFSGFEAGLYYNVQGQTLQFVGIVDRPDIYTVPFHSLNFNCNKAFGPTKRLQVGLKVDNILNDKREAVYKSYKAKDQYFSRLDPGTTFRLKLTYNF